MTPFATGWCGEVVPCWAGEVSNLWWLQAAAARFPEDNSAAVGHLCHQLQSTLGDRGRSQKVHFTICAQASYLFLFLHAFLLKWLLLFALIRWYIMTLVEEGLASGTVFSASNIWPQANTWLLRYAAHHCFVVLFTFIHHYSFMSSKWFILFRVAVDVKPVSGVLLLNWFMWHLNIVLSGHMLQMAVFPMLSSIQSNL